MIDAALIDRLAAAEPLALVGRVTSVRGGVVRADVPGCGIGDRVELRCARGRKVLETEVVGFDTDGAYLTPLGDVTGLRPGLEAWGRGGGAQVLLGNALLGRVLDANLHPVDGKGPVRGGTLAPVRAEPPQAMDRPPIDRPLPTGVRAMDAALTLGAGQRIGVFGEAGGGKSTLLGSIVRGCAADVCVVGLIGERGREVREFVERQLAQSMASSVVVVATSDRPAAERRLAAESATRVAEYFRDQGLSVLLVMDSVTRYARAAREIGLAAGEAPVRRGFPISAFTGLAGLMERAGPAARGTITAIYTILVEGDGEDDPIAEEVRGILDGHVVLSAELAREGHYPAIDLLRSRSRTMDHVVSAAHLEQASRLRARLAALKRISFLLRVGEYAPGSDPEADDALAVQADIQALLRQGPDATAWDDMAAALARAAATEDTA